MDKTIGIGVIGVGMGADLLYVNTDPNTRFEVRGLCARTQAKVERIAQEHGVGFCTTDYRELVARDDVDVVAVFTHDHLHAEHCLAALSADKHVVVTKPMVTSLADAKEIARQAEARGLKFIVGETCRWYSAFLDLKRLHDDGDLGDVLFAEAHYVHELKDYFPLTPWRLEVPQDFMYGGCCHPVDSLVWMLGEIEEVHCYGRRGGVSDYPIEDNFTLNLKFANGVMARVLGMYGVIQPPFPMMGLTVYGSRGTASATFEDFKPSQLRTVLDKFETNEPAVTDYPADMEGAYGQGVAVRNYMAHFEDCLVNDKTPSDAAREGMWTIAALDAAWRSVKSGQPEKVDNAI